MATSPCLPAIFIEGKNFYDFLSASLDDVLLLKRASTLKGKNLLLVPLRIRTAVAHISFKALVY